MGFNIAVSPSFWAEVKLSVTGEDGRLVEGTVKGKFKRLKRDEITAFLAKNKSAVPSADNLLEVSEDWKGVADDAGEMTFTPENFARACQQIPGFALAWSQAFIKGSWGAREGN